MCSIFLIATASVPMAFRALHEAPRELDPDELAFTPTFVLFAGLSQMPKECSGKKQQARNSE
jgi:hypothetical protein